MNEQYFNPDASINNTQTRGKYPQSNSEVKLIENNLSEYLYYFPAIS